MGKFTELLNRKLLQVAKKHYHRDQFNTYMNTFEWENVKDAERIYKFMEEGKSLFHFPFIKRTLNLSWVTLKSISSANKYDSKYKILASEYGLMAGFINFFNALEFVPMGVMGFFARFFINEKNDTPMQKHFTDYFKKYSKDLETIPFYDHNYTEIRSHLSQAYQTEKTNNSLTWADSLTYLAVNTQLLFRTLVSKPLQYMYHQPDNLVPPTTDVLVRYRAHGFTNQEKAIEHFKEKIASIKEAAQVDIVDNHVYAKEKKPNKDYISTYALLSTPRYRAFKNTTALLSQEEIEIKKIAGNDNIQVTCEIDAKDEEAFLQAHAELTKNETNKLLYQYGDSIHANNQTLLFNIPTTHLQEAIKELEQAHEATKVRLIHNF